MRLISVFVAVILMVAMPMTLGAVDPKDTRVPLMRTVDPYTVKAGEVVTITGDNLDKARVAEVYLTLDSKKNIKIQVVEQSKESMKIKVPENLAAGRYRVVVLLTDVEPTFIEEPVRLVVE
jgi:hypothetical protein